MPSAAKICALRLVSGDVRHIPLGSTSRTVGFQAAEVPVFCTSILNGAVPLTLRLVTVLDLSTTRLGPTTVIGAEIPFCPGRLSLKIPLMVLSNVHVAVFVNVAPVVFDASRTTLSSISSWE